MKALLVHQQDPLDSLNWSGTPAAIGNALMNAGVEILPIGPLDKKLSPFFHLRKACFSRLKQGTLVPEWDIGRIRHFGHQVDVISQKKKPDLILSMGVIPIALAKTPIPIIAWTDATFHQLNEYYLQNTCLETRASGAFIEKNALARIQKIIYSSEWAAKSAVKQYNLRREKIEVFEIGSNFSPDLDTTSIKGLIAQRASALARRCEILFLSVDFERKGGQVVTKLLEQLTKQGVDAKLHFVGQTPPSDLSDNPNIIAHGFLKKSDPVQSDALKELFKRSQFLILPSRADCTPVVIAEAMSWGIPVIASDAGGIPEMVTHGENGYIVNSQSDLAQESNGYLQIILKMIGNPETYSEICFNAVDAAGKRFNWSKFSERFIDLASSVLGNKRLPQQIASAR